MKKLISGLLVYALTVSQVFGQAALLPNAKQTFLDTVGNPLVGGSVTFYVPGSTNKKTTWQDSGQASNNPNPVTLDAAGRAVIYGQGVYRQVVKDALGNTIWDAPTTAYGSSVPSGATGTDTAPVGAIMQWSSFALPINWAWANGQALTRVTYPDLLTALTISQTSISCTSGSPTLSGWSDTSQIRPGAPIEATCITPGTVVTAVPSSSTITVSNNAAATGSVTATVFPWGNGDGTLTFNVPDLRGRVPAGPDTMQTTAANRLQLVSTITTTSGATTATVPNTAGVTAGMTVVSANIPAGTAISSVNPSVGTTIITTSGSPTATVGSAAGLAVGMAISAPTVPSGTTISSISGTTVTMSANATVMSVLATVASGSSSVTINSNPGFATGMTTTCSCFPGATTISTISGLTLTMSANATSGLVGTVSFSGTTGAQAATFTSSSSFYVTLSANATATASGTAATFLTFAGANAPGAFGGAQSHTLTIAEMPSHNHTLTDPGHSHGINSTSIAAGGGGGALIQAQVGAAPIPSAISTTGITLAPSGGGQPHLIVQPTLTINYIIKAKANTTGAGGVVSLGGMFGDIVCDGTFQCAPQGSSPAINKVGLAQQANNTMLANVSGGTAQPIPKTWTQWVDSVCGNTQGMTVYRGTSSWNCLSPPASGAAQMLVSSGANPSWSAAATGTVQSVGLALPSIFTVSGSPVTGTGTLTAALNTQSANTVWSGPTTGSAAAPAFRALVGADLPNPSSSTLGGIQSAASVTHQWINSISTSGVPGLSQPAFSDISGQATLAQLPSVVTSVAAGTGMSFTTITGTGSVAIDKATAANYYAATSNKVPTTDLIYPSEVTVTYGATTTFDMSTFINAVVTLTGNITTATFSNIKAGQAGMITFVQDATGSRTLPATFNANFKFAGGTQPVLSTAASSVDVLFYACRTTSYCVASLNKAFN